MKLGNCVTKDYGVIGCARNELRTLDQRCSGKPECSVLVPDQEMTAGIPCIEDLSPYLEAKYICQAGTHSCKVCDKSSFVSHLYD